MPELTLALKIIAIRAEADLRIEQLVAEDRARTVKAWLPDPAPSEPPPWRELNNEQPTAETGTWIQEWPSSNSAFLVDFQTAHNLGAHTLGFILRRGSTTCDLVHTDEFCGWDPDFEDATNGFRHFKTRAKLDVELRKLGILP